MIDQLYDEVALEREVAAHFGIELGDMQIIGWKLPVSHTAEATVLLSGKRQLYVYVTAQARLTLADVKKIVSRMQLKAMTYVPPKSRETYFDDIGAEKFREVFPGRNHVSTEDIAYYRTLAPYSPALVQISEVVDGVIKQFDTDAATGWRPAVKFVYRRIQTS